MKESQKEIAKPIQICLCVQLYTAFGALGGGLSLYLGVAIILLFEIVELGYDLVVNLWRHKRAESKSKMSSKSRD